jgi:hypothetical protein
VGSKGAQALKFGGQVAIGTTVLRRGQVVAHGELWGGKQFGFKPLLVMPAITCWHKVIALGHIWEGSKGKGATLEPWSTK